MISEHRRNNNLHVGHHFFRTCSSKPELGRTRPFDHLAYSAARHIHRTRRWQFRSNARGSKSFRRCRCRCHSKDGSLPCAVPLSSSAHRSRLQPTCRVACPKELVVAQADVAGGGSIDGRRPLDPGRDHGVLSSHGGFVPGRIQIQAEAGTLI